MENKTYTHKFLVPSPGIILNKIESWLSEAPTANDITIELLVDGVPLGESVTISAASTQTTLTLVTPVTIMNGSVIQVKVSGGAGKPNNGADLAVRIYYDLIEQV